MTDLEVLVDEEEILDLFSGPGGWDVGLAIFLGLVNVIGVEWDSAACATRDAAGLKTIQADVAELDPAEFGQVDGLIGSPPCQMFSAAGSKVGRGAIPLLADAIRRIFSGEDPRAEARREAAAVIAAGLKAEAETAVAMQQADEDAPRLAYNACLVLEPARYAMALRPKWIALEQVPSVLPLWEEIARGLRSLGYRTWTGVLDAADYGVPQHRKRAILMAHRDRPVAAPEPTHAKNPEPSLFGPELRPLVTMGEALGWTGRVGFPRRDETSPDGYVERDWNSAENPSRTVTGLARSWLLQPGGWRADGSGNRRNRPLDEPAPTLAFGRDADRWRWIPGDLEPGDTIEVNTGRDWKKGGSREDAQTFDPLAGPAPTIDGKGRWHVEVRRGPRPGDDLGANVEEGFDPESEPAQTVTSRVDRWQLKGPDEWHARRNDQSGAGEVDPDWPLDRPATTLATRDLVTDPGANANRFNGAGKSRNDGYRVEIPEASVLQTFPANYPWQGTRSKIFEQIGNAFPCLLAAHVVHTLTTERPAP